MQPTNVTYRGCSLPFEKRPSSATCNWLLTRICCLPLEEGVCYAPEVLCEHILWLDDIFMCLWVGGAYEDRKLQAVIEQVMVDQLSRSVSLSLFHFCSQFVVSNNIVRFLWCSRRAVISDPEQNAVSVSPTSVPPRYRRTLHHTK